MSTLCMMSSEIALIFSNIGVVPGNFIHTTWGIPRKCYVYMMQCFCMLQVYNVCCMFSACVKKFPGKSPDWQGTVYKQKLLFHLLVVFKRSE